MEPLIAVTCGLLLCLLLVACIPDRHANAHARPVRRLVTGLLGFEVFLAFTLLVTHQLSGATPQSIKLFKVTPEQVLGIGVYYDGATSLMLSLVAFVGFVVSQFSVRYLDGEAAQGRFFRWLCFTVGAVSLMVVSGNLLLFFIAWVMTSLGLHQLLLHYRHRPAAHRAAWTKFAISRLGDAFLIAALILTWKSFGTFEFSELFDQGKSLLSTSQTTSGHVAIAWLLMLGAVTKSAQFPFHVWLPDTMETPTPVSALMHAGIVNAGGYLVIRMSPLIALAPGSLLALSLIGGLTACFAGVVMMTQPSIKRGLAYSTIAQMGFMMLQCGLGAFSAAMLHIIAHSLYKAHAFLTSGSVLTQSRLTASSVSQPANRVSLGWAFFVAAAATTFVYAATLTVFEIHLSEKPSGYVLAFILCLALTTWGRRLLTTARPDAVLIGAAGLTALCFIYVASYAAVDHLVNPVVPPLPSVPVAHLTVAVAFALLAGLQMLLARHIQPTWLAALRVHAANGFYIDALYQRLFVSLAKS